MGLSSESAPVRLRPGDSGARPMSLKSLLSILTGAAALGMLASLLTVQEDLWESAQTLFASPPNSGSRAAWIEQMRSSERPAEIGASSAHTEQVPSIPPIQGAPYRIPPEVIAPSGDDKTAMECFSKRDYGLLVRLNNSSRQFCTEPFNASDGDVLLSSYQHIAVGDADIMATAFRYLRLDLREARVAHDITAGSQDGGGHDPRIVYTHTLAECSCVQPQDAHHGAPRVWRFFLASDPEEHYVACAARPMTTTEWTNGRGEDDAATAEPVVVSGRKSIVLSRKDDHNPFFQLSALFNAWLVMRATGWSSSETQLVLLDKGLPTPMDELQHTMLAPQVPPIRGQDVLGRVLHLETALIAPIETSGPLMTHLNDKQPCHANLLLATFRQEALASMGVSDNTTAVKSNTSYGDKCVVTVISRREYGGRRVQRMWRNEGEVLDGLRADYGDRCVFQSFDFANITMREQMQLMVDSDVVIGMHGAGMVNVAWTRPQTMVVEIFPKRRYRWGYRNMCQYLGCDWHEFRKGKDVMPGRDPDPNAMDKMVQYDEWKAFFGPLLEAKLVQILQQVST